MKRHTLSLLLTFLVLACLRSGAGAQEVRPWTDKASGKQIQASMVSADPKARTVTIQTAEGKSFTLPVDRLADADLAYIKAHLNAPAPEPAAKPAAPAAAAPPPGAPPAATPPAAAPAAAAPAAAAPAAAKAPPGVPAPPRPQVVVVPAKKFKGPASADVLGKVKHVRPRLMMGAEGFAALKARLDTDPTSKTLFANINTTVEQLLALPELTKIYGAEAAAAAPGREGLFRLSHLGAVNYLKGDPRMPDRAVKELLALSKDFSNWNPDKEDICSEFTWGVALGYDWFRPALNADQAKTVRSAIMDLGMEALIALIKEEPVPAVSKRAESGQTKTAPTKAAPAPKAAPKTAAKKREEKEEPVNTGKMKAACALLMAAIAISDEEPAAAAAAANVALKVFNKGMTQFAPDGIWPETIEQGDEVLDMAAGVIMTLRSACGSDFGFTTLEGMPNIGTARVGLTGPAGIFNYGDSRGGGLSRTWVTSWLAALYGNPGVPALKPPAATQPQRAGLLGQVGLLLYNSPYITGYAVPDAMDFAFNGADVATLRSAWNDSKALFVGVKGGANNLPGAQLDLGTFVLDADGVRWAVDLGGEGDRAAGMAKPNDPAKFKLYREGTKGQNVIRFGDDQPVDAKATISGFLSTPERGVAIVDLKGSNAAKVREYHRGVMIVRGAKPYALMQDEIKVKTTASPEWVMHTRATVTADGGKATLKSGTSTLTMTVLSPQGAKFTAEDPPELKEPEGTLKGVKIVKIALGSVKGDQTVTVMFTPGETAGEAAVVPLEQWIPKKK